MRTTKTLSISLPPAQLKDAERLAKKEHRTLSELVREALRSYQYQRQLQELNAQGRAKAAELGITEADVVPVIHQQRREKKTKQPTQ
jgi:CopG family transcriptional regulator/antitoxin EndoAI